MTFDPWPSSGLSKSLVIVIHAPSVIIHTEHMYSVR